MWTGTTRPRRSGGNRELRAPPVCLQHPPPVSKNRGKVNSLARCNPLIFLASANPYRLAAVNSSQRIRGREKRKWAKIRLP